MAKQLIVSYNGVDVAFNLSKIERSKIYGSRKRIAIDKDGNICNKVALSTDGTLLLKSGMVGQSFFSKDGRAIQRSEMIGLDSSGKEIISQPSTLGISQELTGPLDPQEVFDFISDSIYLLEPEVNSGEFINSLHNGNIYRCPFRYTSSLDSNNALLLSNDEGIFALIGKVSQSAWSEETKVFISDDSPEDDSSDLDFESL